MALALTKLSETQTKITLGWTPVPGAIGYRFQSATQAPKWSHTWEALRDQVTFSKADWYKVEALGISEAGLYPTATPPPPDGFTLQEVDGGPAYYGQFSNPLPSTPDYFPIGVWFESVQSQADVDKDKDAGLNLYVGLTANSSLALVRSNGLHAIIQAGERTRFSGFGAETVGWELHDEIDMQAGPPDGNGYEQLDAILAGLPQDGRARYNNYGKGVMFWETDAQAAQFVNKYQQLVSNDIYWFTDPNERSQARYGKASSYGYTVERMRMLDAMDGPRKPIWNFVEVGWPFTESASAGGRSIAPAEIRAAVWHSIISGARGIIYFNHSFGGPNLSQHCLRDSAYAAQRASVKAVNAQIKSLAPVLNSPSLATGFTATSVKALAKWDGQNFYVFAGSKDNAASQATFTLPSGTQATVIGENRMLPVTNGSFSDSFADGNAVHIYKVS